MGRYLLRRGLMALLTVLGVATIVFVALRLVPGGIAQTLAGPNVAQSPQLIAAVEKKYGLDQPVIVQYGVWLGNAVRGDLGESFGTRASVSGQIVERIGLTMELTAYATALSLLLGVPIGVFAALRRGSGADLGTRTVSLLGLSIPEFVLGTLLIYVVSTRGIDLPISAYVPWGEDAGRHLRAMVLPTATLAVAATAVVIRVVRASVSEVLAEPYVTTARAKGLHPRVVARRHVLRAALIPTVTIVGINMGYLLSGAVIVEQLFSLPGLGRFALQGVLNRDYPVAQGAVIVGALTFVLTNLLTDVLYAVLDPRIKY